MVALVFQGVSKKISELHEHRGKHINYLTEKKKEFEINLTEGEEVIFIFSFYIFL